MVQVGGPAGSRRSVSPARVGHVGVRSGEGGRGLACARGDWSPYERVFRTLCRNDSERGPWESSTLVCVSDYYHVSAGEETEVG